MLTIYPTFPITAMKKYTQTELFFDNISGKKLSADFEGEAMSTDGSVLLLRQIEKRTGVIAALSNNVHDIRHQSCVEHRLYDLINQQVMQIACGYSEAVVSNALRTDAAIKTGCDRLPLQLRHACRAVDDVPSGKQCKPHRYLSDESFACRYVT